MYHLVGNFNNWQTGLEHFTFQEVTIGDPFGWQMGTGEFHLSVESRPGKWQFKIVEDNDWSKQWSVMGEKQELGRNSFLTRDGMRCHLFVRRGGDSPHAEIDVSGGKYRLDFHPASQTLAIHSQVDTTPGIKATPWETFEFDVRGKKFSYGTHLVLPYGFCSSSVYRYPVYLFFDGGNLIYGEDRFLGIAQDRNRQYPRVFSSLSRLGVIPPAVIVGLEVPRAEDGGDYRGATYLGQDSFLHQAFQESIMEQMLPTLEDNFPVLDHPRHRYLLGHSNGGDMALAMMAEHAGSFRGVVSISPSNAYQLVKRFSQMSLKERRQLRVYISFSQNDLRPNFLLNSAATKPILEQMDIPHLVQYAPGHSHDPGCGADILHSALGFVST